MCQWLNREHFTRRTKICHQHNGKILTFLQAQPYHNLISGCRVLEGQQLPPREAQKPNTYCQSQFPNTYSDWQETFLLHLFQISDSLAIH